MKGHGIRCCGLASSRVSGDRRRAKAAAAYDNKLAALGKVVRLEPYRDARTPILHRCLIHGEQHLLKPDHAQAGHGLRCCKQAAVQARADCRKATAAAIYDDKLTALGKLVRLGPYLGAHDLILHRCLEHGEEHQCSPAQTLSGSGLRCCRLASLQATSDRARTAAAARYDANLAKFGRLERLEPYAGALTPILHRCLVHEEEHRCAPTHALAGQGLRCCGFLPNSLDLLIRDNDDPQLLEPCQLYAYTVPGRPGLAKPGIARNHDRRAAQGRGLYGELLAVWDMPTRRDALLVEGAILRDASIASPVDLGELGGLAGAGEVREIDADALVAHAQSLVDSLAEHAGPWQVWLLDNVPGLSRAERKALRQQLAVIQPSPKLEP
ncbi:hypothetical protein [Vulcanococcus limneticus]|uniref:hypothetical protein n=1 Tax=Vulcanococcus limneticus TaxID=2170428 RepID=UPI00398C0596